MSKDDTIVNFKSIFDLFPDAIFIINKENLKIEFCNFESQNLLSKSDHQIKGTDISQIFSKQYILKANLKEIIKKKGVFFIKDKFEINKLFFELICITSDDLGNSFMLVLKKLVSDSDRQLAVNQEHFSEVFSILAHEINNPISSIRLASDLIRKRYVNVESELLNIINSEAKRITRLFTNFNLSKGNNFNAKTRENIHELIRICLFKIKKFENLTIIEEFDPSLPTLLINKDLIMQSFDNILSNSYESSNLTSGSFIKIQTKFVIGEVIKIPNIKDNIKKNLISIIFTDNGSGIDKVNLGKIFLPFFSTKKRGSGIGLFLVKKIIDDHDGSIVIESDKEVTSVKITLPI